MSFMVERIPDEAKKKFPEVDRPFTTKWVIDRNRDAFMAWVNKHGGPYDGTPEWVDYMVYWQGEIIHLTAERGRETFPPEGATMNWRIIRLKMPDALRSRRDEVLQLIRDAFRAVGWAFDGDRYAAVNVAFDLPSHQ